MDIMREIVKEQLKTDITPFRVGDTVKVMETRPLSKDKRWRLVEVMERAK